MSVTITQQPTTPNAAYTRLVYVVSGSVTTTEPQYQYVMDVYESGSTELINRITQVPNPQGVAVFDPSPILQGQLQNDNNWRVTGITSSSLTSKTFDIKFGEQYGTSPSSSVTVYTGSTSNTIQVFPAVVNENNGISYNFPSGSFLLLSGSTTADIVAGDGGLTNDPHLLSAQKAVYPWIEPGVGNPKPWKVVNNNDYETVSFLRLQGNAWGGDTPSNYYFPYRPYTVVYSGSVEVGNQDLLPIPDLNWPNNIVSMGVGPKNLAASVTGSLVNTLNNGEYTHYIVSMTWVATDNSGYWPVFDGYFFIQDKYSADTTGLAYQGAPIYPYQTEQQVGCIEDYVRFAFINQYGVWDYYNIYNPVRTNTDLQRESFSNSFVNYSTNPSPYNANRRGDTQTYSASTDRYSIDTDYLDKETANWLEELMESPSVYLQEGDNFVPIIITNTEYRTNNSTARNKLFKYTIEWEYANARRSRI